MKNALLIVFALLTLTKIGAQNNYNEYSIVIKGEKERVKSIAHLAKSYLVSQGTEADFHLFANEGYNDPSFQTVPKTNGTWIYIEHPHSGTSRYIQISNTMLASLQDKTSNTSTFMAIFKLCPVQSQDAIFVLNRVPLKKKQEEKIVEYNNYNINDDLFKKKEIPNPFRNYKKENENLDVVAVEMNSCNDYFEQQYPEAFARYKATGDIKAFKYELKAEYQQRNLAEWRNEFRSVKKCFNESTFWKDARPVLYTVGAGLLTYGIIKGLRGSGTSGGSGNGTPFRGPTGD